MNSPSKNANAYSATAIIDASVCKSDQSVPDENMSPGRFLTLKQVQQSIGFKTTTIYKLMKDPENPLPQPIKIGRSSRWAETDVERWKRDHMMRAGLIRRF